MGFIRGNGEVHLIEHGVVGEAGFIGEPVAEFVVEGTGQYQVGMF